MTTQHSIERAKERAGISKTFIAKHLIEDAIKYGESADSFNKREREFLQSKEYKPGYRALVYDRFCFIVSDNFTCVTMFPLPEWFVMEKIYVNIKKKYKGRKKQHIGKRKQYTDMKTQHKDKRVLYDSKAKKGVKRYILSYLPNNTNELFESDFEEEMLEYMAV